MAADSLDTTISQFVSALRNADVEVSPAETLDAVAAIELIGIQNKSLLYDSLSIILAKTIAEKAAFKICFDRFFNFQPFRQSAGKIELNPDQDSTMSNTGQSAAMVEAGQRQVSEDSLFENQPSQNPSLKTSQKISRKNSSGKQRLQTSNARTSAVPRSRLAEILLSQDQTELVMALAVAAKAVSLKDIKTLRERALYTRRIMLHLGLSQLEGEIEMLLQSEYDKDVERGQTLVMHTQTLARHVKDYVEQQYLLLVDASGNQFLTDALAQTKLTNIQVQYFARMKDTVRQIAHQLARQHAKKRKVTNRGQLDLRKTLRKNVAYDGALFDLKWKQTKLEKPAIYVICDVSGSVRNVSRFLLTFLYSLSEVLPHVRSFAFSSDLGECSDYFADYPLEKAIEMSLADYGGGSTDYGAAFNQFNELCLRDIDSRATVIVLGDARNNYFTNGKEALRSLSNQCHQLIWLNPEPKKLWFEGDSEMKTYLPFCQVATVCNSLTDLQRAAASVLRRAR